METVLALQKAVVQLAAADNPALIRSGPDFPERVPVRSRRVSWREPVQALSADLPEARSAVLPVRHERSPDPAQDSQRQQTIEQFLSALAPRDSGISPSSV
jgi:hypothetical protein